jgi:hypothetical protein
VVDPASHPIPRVGWYSRSCPISAPEPSPTGLSPSPVDRSSVVWLIQASQTSGLYPAPGKSFYPTTAAREERGFRCLVFFRSLRPSPSSTRARGAVWHVRSPSGSLSQGGRSRGLPPGERCQGFSPLQPRLCSFVRLDLALQREQRPLAPCAHRLGEPTKTQNLGRAMSPCCRTR